MNDPRRHSEVQGYGVQPSKPTPGALVFSKLTDFSIALCIYSVAVDLDWISPLPSLSQALVFLTIIFTLFLFFQFFFGGTLGQILWRLSLYDKAGNPVDTLSRYLIYAWEKITFKKEKTFVRRQDYPFPTSHQIGSTTITLASLGVSVLLLGFLVLHHPVIRSVQDIRIQAFTPGERDPDWKQHWVTLPFYYSFGAWPKQFQGRPVLYQLPYASGGPPKNFVSKIIARWKMPEIQMTFEGPKTPTPGVDPGEIKSCFSGWTHSFRCYQIKNKILSRHLSEIQSINPKTVQIQWFEVNNPNVPPQEQARGLLITAKSKRKTQERFIVITHQGAHQSFILSRENNSDGEEASLLFRQTLGSLQVAGELRSGKSFVTRSLAQVKLENLDQLTQPQTYATELAEVQARLLSKISVDPKDYDAFYHLAGTAYYFGKYAMSVRTRKTQVLSDSIAGQLEEWTATSRPLIEAALAYANDIEPTHPKKLALEQIALEAKRDF